MGVPKRVKEGLFTYRDYLTWPEGERWELINGVAYDMSPAPSRRHQGVLMYLATRFATHFEGRPCSVYFAPFDVVLTSPDHAGSEEESDTVVQPDLVVVRDPSRLTKRGCTGGTGWESGSIRTGGAFPRGGIPASGFATALPQAGAPHDR
jgi:hypothetical protein